MTEYIERSRLLERARKVTEYDEGGWCTTYQAVSVRDIGLIPAADVAPVVRCKDCKHGKMHVDIIGEPHLFCCNGMSIYRRKVEFDDFCSYGERKQG